MKRIFFNFKSLVIQLIFFGVLLGASQVSFAQQDCRAPFMWHIADKCGDLIGSGFRCSNNCTIAFGHESCCTELDPVSSSSSSSASSVPPPPDCAPHLTKNADGYCVCPNEGTEVNTGNLCESTCPFGHDPMGMCYPDDCPYGDGPPAACNDRNCSNEGHDAIEVLPGMWICEKQIPDSGSSSSSGSDDDGDDGSGPGGGGNSSAGGQNSSTPVPVSSASSTSSFENPVCPIDRGWMWSGTTCFKLPPEEGEEPDPDPPGGPNCGSGRYWNGVQCLPTTGSSSSSGSGGDDDVVIPDTSSSAGSSVAGGGGAGDGFCKGKEGEDDDKDCSGIYNPDGHFLDIQDRYDQAKETYQTTYEELSGELRDRLSLELGGGRDELACNPQNIRGASVELGICARRDFFDLIRNLFVAVASILSAYIILRKD